MKIFSPKAREGVASAMRMPSSSCHAPIIICNMDLKKEGTAMNYGGLLTWWLLMVRTFSQLPQLSAITKPRLFGKCRSLEPFMLGEFQHPSRTGLVSYSLVAIARRDQSQAYLTTQFPSVQIVSAVRTCQSRDVLIAEYNTASFLVSYTCKGIACEQPPDNVRIVSYVHLFSFVCQRNHQYTVWNHVPGYDVHINRTTTNSISNPTTTLSGSCALCTTDPIFYNNPHFDPVTGCIGEFYLSMK